MRSLTGVLACLVLATGALPRAAAAQDWRTVTMTRRAEGESSLNVDVEYGAGKLTIAPTSEPLLYRAMIRYDADHYHPITDYSDGRLHIGIKSSENVHLHDHDSGHLTLDLGTRVPTILDLKFGAVQADVDLGGVRLTRAHIATGASEATVRFSKPNPEPMSMLRLDVGAASFTGKELGNANTSNLVVHGGVADLDLGFRGAWQRDMSVEVKMGLGSVTFHVPQDVAVRVHRHGFLASFDAAGFTKRGGDYYSSNWDGAKRRLIVDVESALGSFDIDWVGAATAAGQ